MPTKSVVECRHCGYLTSGSETTCARCNASLVDAVLISVSGAEEAEQALLDTAPPAPGSHPPPNYSAAPPYHPAAVTPARRAGNKIAIVVFVLFALGLVGAVIALPSTQLAWQSCAPPEPSFLARP